jgi:hypothetical protein
VGLWQRGGLIGGISGPWASSKCERATFVMSSNDVRIL